jgi:membrane associated rhomboid family serine protease
MNKLLAKLPDELKSLPLLSVGLALVWLLTGLVVELGSGSMLRESRDAHYQAARLTANDPTIEVNSAQMKVVRAVNPDFENDSLLEFMRRNSSQEAVEQAQSTFDDIAATASFNLSQHPYRRVGLIPANRDAKAFLMHWFVHSGFIHLMASVCLLLLAAPLLEKRWGAPILALNMSIIVLGSAAIYALAHADSQRPLVGGSALIAGLVAAILIRKSDEIDFLEWLSPVVDVSLVAPTGALAGLWLVYEAALWFTAQGALPPGADNAVGYSAHAGAMVLGGGLALLMGKLGLEKDAIASAGSGFAGKRSGTKFDLQKIAELKKNGEIDNAYRLLDAEVKRSARNRNVVLAYWETAVEIGKTAEAAPTLLRLIEEELRRGAYPVVPQIWKALYKHEPKVLLDAPLLIRLAPHIERKLGEEDVAIALRQALDKKNKGLTPDLAASVARMAVEVDTRLAAKAAKRALASKDLDETTRSEMQMLATALAPNDPEYDAPDATIKKGPDGPQASVFFEESDRSAFGDVGDLSEMADETFPDGAIQDGVPVSISAQGLTIQFEDRGQSTVAFTRMRAISVVGVRGLGPNPVVLMDIMIDGGGTPDPLVLLRMRCDRFEPRTLIPKASSSKDALRAIVQGLQKRGLKVLADVTAPSTDSKPIFESCDAYHDKVLRPIASEFA